MSSDDEWLIEARRKLEKMPEKAREVRELALQDLYFFATLVNPGYMYGDIHKEIFLWMQDYNLYKSDEAQTGNKLIMLPRAHLKSHMVATWCAWIICRHPEVTILYLSATAELAISQLYSIQNILCSSVFQRYFPEYIHPQEGKREKWCSTSIMIDHPKRASEGIRDATVKIAGLTTNTTGWHADIIVSDDLVVPENAYTEDGRENVAKKASQFTSIRNPGGITMACGTRYHPSDVYSLWKESVYDEYDSEGLLIGTKPTWDIKEYKVEEDGVFLWPRRVRSDGKAFGFNIQVLARIKAEYLDRVQFYAQYYNDPNDPQSERISRDKFQYYDQRFLKRDGSVWYYKERRLNVYAAVDFAFSMAKGADFTAIVVIGLDSEGNIYVLDIDRFKTDKTIDYFKHIADLHSRWRFKKLRAEVSVAQKVIVNGIKDYIKREGMVLAVEEARPNRIEGSKEERIAAALEPKYDAQLVWHYEGGWIPTLEEELILARPPHDDIKDAFASAMTIAVAPTKSVGDKLSDFLSNKTYNTRFGGVNFRG